MIDISASVSALIARYKAAKSDGKVTLTECVQLVIQATNEVVQITQELVASGAEKKAAALNAVERFIDHVVTPLDLPGVPNLIEPIFDQGIKSLLMLAADAAIEAAVKLFNQIGWPQVKELPEG